ncbi:hypothetical protein GCM10027589_58620 [Actinocorallia lasiicapitis]
MCYLPLQIPEGGIRNGRCVMGCCQVGRDEQGERIKQCSTVQVEEKAVETAEPEEES